MLTIISIKNIIHFINKANLKSELKCERIPEYYYLLTNSSMIFNLNSRVNSDTYTMMYLASTIYL